MVAPFAALEARTLSAGYGRLANAEVVRGAGQPGFNAILDLGTADTFDAVRTGRITLRMPAQPSPVGDGEILQINSASYRVAGIPEELPPGDEALAVLVKL